MAVASLQLKYILESTWDLAKCVKDNNAVMHRFSTINVTAVPGFESAASKSIITMLLKGAIPRGIEVCSLRSCLSGVEAELVRDDVC
jgi:hypothetical protein